MDSAWLLAAAATLGACGRLGFESVGDSDESADDTDSDPDTTDTSDGPPIEGLGPRWAVDLGTTQDGRLGVSGTLGELVVSLNFVTSRVVGDATLLGQSPFGSEGVVRFDGAGAVRATSVLDSRGICDARNLAAYGDGVMALALTISTEAASELGACAVQTNRQDPIVLAVAPDGAQALLAHGVASGANAQAWHGAELSDGSIVITGVYSAGLAFGATMLANAEGDPNSFVARVRPGQAEPLWAHSITGPSMMDAGPVAADGTDVCVIGERAGDALVLGAALPTSASTDTWVARVDAAGTARWVRLLASDDEDATDLTSAVIATPDGGCLVALGTAGDLAIGALSLPRSDGQAVVVAFDATGTATGGFRLPNQLGLARVGTRLYGAFTVDADLTINDELYEPDGADVVVVELVDGKPVRVVGEVIGAGDQYFEGLAAIGNGALAIGVRSRGEFQFGDTTFDQTEVYAAAVLGVED